MISSSSVGRYRCARGGVLTTIALIAAKHAPVDRPPLAKLAARRPTAARAGAERGAPPADGGPEAEGRRLADGGA